MMGGGFLILIEMLPIDTFLQVVEFLFEGWGEEAVVTGGEEKTIGVALEKKVGKSISTTIEEAKGIGLSREKRGSLSEGGLEVCSGQGQECYLD